MSVYTQERERLTRDLLKKELAKRNQNITQTARALGITRTYMQYLVRRYSLKT